MGRQKTTGEGSYRHRATKLLKRKPQTSVYRDKSTVMGVKAQLLREISSMGSPFRLQQKPQEHHPIHLQDNIHPTPLRCKEQAIIRVLPLLCPNYRFKVTSLMLTDHR